MSVKDRGFASMSQKKRDEIARKGGEERKRVLGRAGYSAMGKKGGAARKQKKDEQPSASK